MLVLSRKEGQSIQIGNDIRITLTRSQHGKSRIGIEAPDHIKIVRSELINWHNGDLDLGDLEDSIDEEMSSVLEFADKSFMDGSQGDTMALNADKADTVDADSLEEIIDEEFPTRPSAGSQVSK